MSIFSWTLATFDRRVLAPFQHATPTAMNSRTGIRARRYRTYADYVRHQTAKLRRHYPTLVEHDRAYEEIVARRYADLDLAGKTVLCLGARLGGEVRAFARLGALAVGVDLEPGPDNPHVLPGDVHKLQFADDVFDYAFTNILDHVLDIDAFLAETSRVLKPEGRLIAEIAQGPIKNYEVNDLTDGRLRAVLAQRLRLESEAPITNKTDYTNWAGILAIYANAKQPPSLARRASD